jgi:succinate dehydrogenase / fumarate reductase membrane anchor subunit
MALYTLLLVGAVMGAPSIDYDSWRAIFAPAWMKLATLLFLVSLFPHIWVGVRNIFMDYVSNSGLRLAAHVFAILWLIACAAWCVRILWSI